MAEQSNASQRLEQNLSGLESSLRMVRREVDALASRVGDVEETQTNQADQVDELHARLDQIVDAIDDQRSLLTDVHAQVGRLASRIDWLEHHLHRVADMEPVDLDHPDDPEDGTPDDLVHRIQAGQEAESALLGAEERAELEARCASYAEVQREKLQWDQRVVELSRPFADEPAPGEDRIAAAEEFDEAAGQSETLGDRLRRASPRYRSDRDRLARDDDERERAQPAVQAGLDARAELRDRMRDRIEAAVGERALMPAWFTAELGYGPPTADAADAAHWLDTAAEVMAYRLAHGIDDPTTALGDLPEAAPPAQRRWRDELAARLAAVHQP